MYTLAKFLQALGLVLLPVALWYGLSHEGEGVLARELMLLALGVVLFYAGRRLEGGAGR